MIDKTEKLLKLARRHAEISCEIKNCQSQMEVNLQHCNKTKDEYFEFFRKDFDNCLNVSFNLVKHDREENYDCYNGTAHLESFKDVLFKHGCINCKGAHSEKKKIGKLKQERGRIHSAITKIGQTL